MIFITLLISLAATAPAQGRAAALQQPVDELQWLTIDLWPDYDRSSVLVLMTGALAADAPLPAQVSLPLPANATLNAVARIDDAGQMIDDIVFENSGGLLTLTTPDRRFRVEYYLPYSGDGLQRQFTFNWPGGPGAAQMDLSVQQPLAAASIAVQPEPETVITGSDGLQYHNLPMRALGAAEAFSVTVSYIMTAEQLSATGLAPGPAAPADGATTAAGAANWPLILGAAGAGLLVAAVGWHLYSSRTARRAPPKPRPARAGAPGRAAFCHECGAQASAEDRFCRQCGTRLKRGQP